MSDNKHTVVLVLRSGGDFSFQDVELIVRHINNKWKSSARPRIICLFDKVSQRYDLGNFELIPLNNELPGTWARMQLYSPAMEQYRPFLYVDLDTAIMQSLENIFALVKDATQFITLEDFWQKGSLATGLAWIPANSPKISKIWHGWAKVADYTTKGSRMDYFLRKVVKPDIFWQQLTSTICDFKPRPKKFLVKLPDKVSLVCFHGKPRIFEAANKVGWVRQYVEDRTEEVNKKVKATVIISYKKDRGWLQDAIDSVPSNVQLILSQNGGNWAQDFNKVLPQVQGKYIKYLHEDDMLTENCINDSIWAIETQCVDFIHGNVVELYQGSGKRLIWRPPVRIPTLQSLLNRNTVHSASMMYRKEVFDKIGGFDETLDSSEDYEFNLRCLYNGMKIGYCPSILAYYRRHATQKVRTTKKYLQREQRELIKSKYKIAV